MIYLILAIVIFLLLNSSIKILQEYERGYVFRLGIYVRSYGPGLSFHIPFLENLVRIDLRVITVDLPTQEVITQDNISIQIDAIYCFQYDPDTMYYHAEYEYHVSETVQGMLRAIIGQLELDDILTDARDIDELLCQRVREHENIQAWFIHINYVGIKSIKLPDFIQRAMAKQAEAERQKRAKAILALGEFESSQQLAQAGVTVGSQPETIHLRYLQVLTQLTQEQSRVIIFPFSIQMLADLAQLIQAKKHRLEAERAREQAIKLRQERKFTQNRSSVKADFSHTKKSQKLGQKNRKISGK